MLQYQEIDLRHFKSHTDSDIIEELQSEDVAVLTGRFAKRLGHVVFVPRNFDFVRPLIKKLLEKDEEIRQKKATEQYYWYEPKFETPLRQHRLRIMALFFLHLLRWDVVDG